MKGQLFTIDFILGLMITISAIVAVIVFVPTHAAPFTEDRERINTLMTEGVPADWNAANVIVPGFLTDGRFNRSKIDAFAALPLEDQQRLLGIRSEYTIRFSYNGTLLDLCLTCGTAPLDSGSIAVINRYAVLDGNVTTMEVLLFE